MVWSTTSLTLYHGTIGPHADAIGQRIDLNVCKPHRDFGRGFYTTRIHAQAMRFAVFKYRAALFDHQRKGTIDPEYAAIVEFRIDLSALADLQTLAFVEPTADWRSFTQHCRRTGLSHKPNNNYYQAVYGPVASNRGMIPYYEQISFHDSYAVSLLRLVKVDKWIPP